MLLKNVTVTGLGAAMTVVDALTTSSQYVVFTPLPDDQYEIAFKPENQATVDRVLARGARIEYRCPRCNSTDVKRDADASWDTDLQAWVQRAVYDYTCCNSCGAERIEDLVVENLDDPSGQPVVNDSTESTIHSHAYSLAFDVYSRHTIEHVTELELMTALKRRVREFETHTGLIEEACGAPFDTDQQ